MGAKRPIKEVEVPHILIIRLSAMGDVAMLPPVVEKLREDFPDLQITILTRPAYQTFFRGIPNLDFIAPDFKKQYKGILGILRLRKEIIKLGITHIADLHDVIRTKIIRKMLLLSGIRVAVIDKGRDEKRALTRKYHKIMVQLKSSPQRYIDVIHELGFCMGAPGPVKRTARNIPEEVLEMAGPKAGTWIGVAPFAKHAGKIYPTKLSGDFIEMLAKEYKRVFIFGGGAYEKEFAECIEDRYDDVFSVIGKLRIGQEMDLISNLDIMVTMDSASMHIASLVGTPVISVWGATHPFAGFYGYGQDPENTVQLDLPCRPCSVYGNNPCIYNDYRCLHQIEPAAIFNKVREALKNGDSAESGK